MIFIFIINNNNNNNATTASSFHDEKSQYILIFFIVTKFNTKMNEYSVPVKQMNESTSHGSNSNLAMVHEGDGVEYRMHSVDKTNKKKAISLWHDITLVHVDDITGRPTPYLNFVNEIPKFSR